jgi:hypothetical protein
MLLRGVYAQISPVQYRRLPAIFRWLPNNQVQRHLAFVCLAKYYFYPQN